MKLISSRDNPLFKHLRALLEDARARREEGASIIDGEHLLEAAIDAHWHIRRLIVQESVGAAAAERWLVAIQRQGLIAPEVISFSDALFRQLSPVMTPTGFLAEIAVAGPVPEELHDGDVLVLAGIQDAGNLGSLMRSAVAAGIRQVWLDRQCTQPWSPKALRAGMGAQFHLSIREGCDLPALLAADARPVAVTSLGQGCRDLYELDLRSPHLWVFGSEGQGVPAQIVSLADIKVRIPMAGNIESLNVGAAAAICLFEQLRQRQG
ncbi:TrmH family RNA methyltransferase [Uliginosibacterium paludis]|uniref:RNA methyltransferase n=1 Tax=Uliginosibacterium paludis TaxID=1615952 RepID=A0ABV2CKG4_9RHOO